MPLTGPLRSNDGHLFFVEAHMKFGHALIAFVVIAVLILLNACQVNTPTLDNLRDSKLFDRRIKETPRQKVIRECQQETERFQVNCLSCHGTDKVDAIQSPEHLALTKIGERARIMRKSPTFGLNQACANCHQSKFRLSRSADKLFGPGGTKRGDAQKELQPTP